MFELRFPFLFLLFISVPLNAVYSQDMETERSVLLKFRQQLGNPPAIESWNSSSSPCDWPEIVCTDILVTEVHLPSKNITVRIPPTICDLKNLTLIDLAWNYIPGEFPTLYNCSKLQILDLSQNYFAGPIPDDIDRLSTLVYLDITANNFSGNIPPSIGRLPELQTLYVLQNQFNGTFPKEIGNLSNLEILGMAYNQFVPMNIPPEFGQLKKLQFLWMKQNNLIGEIPESFNGLSSLEHLDLAINNLEGPIPNGLFSLKNLTYVYLFHNNLSGEIPKSIDALNMVKIDLSMNNLNGFIPILKLPDCNSKFHEPKKLSSKFLAMVLALAILVFLAILLLALFLVRDYRRKKCGRHLETWKLTSFRRLDFTEGTILSNLTENNLIGSGGSGNVYRIVNNRSGESVAVKKIWNSKKLDHKSEKEFLAEVEMLGNIRHANIVKLQCCISSEDSKLLVYEYMENQSLDRWLHGNKRRSMSGMSSVNHAVLDWPTRMRTAVGAAQGLCYMHHECPTPIIHRDVKSSNILLDSEFKAKIADFGLAKMLIRHATSHTISAVAGSSGYLAPEYAYTTKVNAKVDVYGFGVVLLELVTGREANSDENMSLVEWACQHFSEEKPMLDIIDPEIKEPFYWDEMKMVYNLGILCTRPLPSTRPSMEEVLHVLRWCCPSDSHGSKRLDFDVAPLPGTANATYLSSYKRRKKGSEEDGSTIYTV